MTDATLILVDSDKELARALVDRHGTRMIRAILPASRRRRA